MKANQHSLWKDDARAQVGIGTMIVFIATILVAATAAAVLIDTSGKLQERSSQTGNQATEQVASNLIVKGAYGYRYETTGTLDTLNVTLALAPGASAVDIKQVKIVMTDGTTKKELSWVENEDGGDSSFYHNELRDPKNTMSDATPTLTAGGLVNLQVNLTNIGMNLAERASVTFMIIPEVGSPVHADFTTPPSFGADKAIYLR